MDNQGLQSRVCSRWKAYRLYSYIDAVLLKIHGETALNIRQCRDILPIMAPDGTK